MFVFVCAQEKERKKGEKANKREAGVQSRVYHGQNSFVDTTPDCILFPTLAARKGCSQGRGERSGGTGLL